MIIASDTTLAVGEHRTGRATDKDCEWCDIAFVVLREATEDEYQRFAIEHGASEDDAFRLFTHPVRFYEVAMD